MAESFDTVFADLVGAITPLVVVDQGVSSLIHAITEQLEQAASMSVDAGATAEQTQPYADLASALNSQAIALAAAVQANTPAESGPSAVTAPAGPKPQPVITMPQDKGWPTTGENPNPPEQPVDQNAPEAGMPPPPDTIPDEGELPPENQVEGEETAPEDETAEARKARLEHNLARRRERWNTLHRPKGVAGGDPNALPPGYQPTDRGPLTDEEAHNPAASTRPTAWPTPYGATAAEQGAGQPGVHVRDEHTQDPSNQEHAEGENDDDPNADPDKPRRRHRGRG